MTRRRSRAISLWFVYFLVVIGVVGLTIGGRAQTAILESQAGVVSTFTLNPSAAGFRAFTTSSETALVLHTAVSGNAGAVLVGATFLAEADNESGGTVLSVPATFADPALSGQTLAQLFSTCLLYTSPSPRD